MPADKAITIASLTHLTDPKEPRLKNIHLSTLAGETMALASDKYVLGKYDTEATATGEFSEPIEWELTAAGAKFITANVKPLNKWHTPAPVIFEVNEAERMFTIRAGAATFSDEWEPSRFTSSAFTTLLRTVEQWEPREEVSEFTVATRFLMKLGKLMNGFTKVDNWLMAMGASPNEARPERLGPIRASSNGLTVLIQPRLTND